MCNKIFFYSITERFKDIIKPFVNSLIMLILIKLISFNFDSVFMELVIKIFVGIISYVILCVLSKDAIFKLCIIYCKNYLNKREKKI